MLRRLILAPLAFLVLGLAACSGGNPDTAGRLAGVGLLYVTGKVITASPERAALAVEISTAALGALHAGELGTLAALDAYARDRLDMASLSPLDRLAAEEVLAIIGEELALRVPLEHDGQRLLTGPAREHVEWILVRILLLADGTARRLDAA